MTTPTDKLIAAKLYRDVGEPVGAADGYGTRVPHYVPDTRCANALRVAVKALKKVEDSNYDYMTGKFSEEVAEEALAEIIRKDMK